MDTARRKIIGRKIRRARLAAGYRSQKAFADAIGVDESSVGHAESGSKRIGVGSRVFTLIEDHLKWPENCIEQYLTTGDEAQLPGGRADEAQTSQDQTEYEEIKRMAADAESLIQQVMKRLDDIERRRSTG